MNLFPTRFSHLRVETMLPTTFPTTMVCISCQSVCVFCHRFCMAAAACHAWYTLSVMHNARCPFCTAPAVILHNTLTRHPKATVSFQTKAIPAPGILRTPEADASFLPEYETDRRAGQSCLTCDVNPARHPLHGAAAVMPDLATADSSYCNTLYSQV